MFFASFDNGFNKLKFEIKLCQWGKKPYFNDPDIQTIPRTTGSLLVADRTFWTFQSEFVHPEIL